MFVASFRLLPAGLLLLAYASSRGRPQPKTVMAWLAISLFALVDAAAFQARGRERQGDEEREGMGEKGERTRREGGKESEGEGGRERGKEREMEG